MPLTGCSLLVSWQRGWYKTENEYYLLQFTLTVRCLYYTSFSLEFCWQQLPAGCPFYSFAWAMAYVFYYPVFHNGPILSFPDFIGQVGPCVILAPGAPTLILGARWQPGLMSGHSKKPGADTHCRAGPGVSWYHLKSRKRHHGSHWLANSMFPFIFTNCQSLGIVQDDLGREGGWS